MGYDREMIVSNSGPLIHFAKIGRLNLLKELFGEVIIPLEVRIEVVDRGKDEGMADAFLIESEIENGWIVAEKSNGNKVRDIARSAGIDIGEASAIMLARRKKCPILIDDLAARRFAAGLGLAVRFYRCSDQVCESENNIKKRGIRSAGKTWKGHVAGY